MTSLADKQAAFTAAMEPMMTRLAAGRKVYGVSLVPIHVYGVGRPELVGKKCMVLGKERAGIYTDKFNFFGGKVDDKAGPLADVLFEETYEEFGVILTPDLFRRSLVSRFAVPVNDGVSLLFVCHITGISQRWWNQHVLSRGTHVPWNFQEMSAIEHVPIEAPTVDISDYVQTALPLIFRSFELLSRENSTRLSSFEVFKL
jgi:8-oxo-dGTP pyrophosphatase MutT (NUDIX family)